MSLHRINADEALDQIGDFDAIIDARSEGEFALDHLPGAINWPVLHDDERVRVGTLYAQVSPFEAQKVGAALIARNVAAHIEREVLSLPKSWQPLIYCWRGGMRSGAMAHILGQIGFKVHVLHGGYKAFRRVVLAQLPALSERLRYRIVCGPTGSGKTRLLHALQAAGAQVLDLEALAAHRASVLGAIPGQPQPSQKQFETRLWQALRGFDPARVVYVEAESKKVGNCAVPDSLMTALRASPCVRIDLPDDERVALLMADYAFFAHDPAFFSQRLEALTALRGRTVVQGWIEQVQLGHTRDVVRGLLAQHYDPGYAVSTLRNFPQFSQAQVLTLPDAESATLQQAAERLHHGDNAP